MIKRKNENDWSIEKGLYKTALYYTLDELKEDYKKCSKLTDIELLALKENGDKEVKRFFDICDFLHLLCYSVNPWTNEELYEVSELGKLTNIMKKADKLTTIELARFAHYFDIKNSDEKEDMEDKHTYICDTDKLSDMIYAYNLMNANKQSVDNLFCELYVVDDLSEDNVRDIIGFIFDMTDSTLYSVCALNELKEVVERECFVQLEKKGQYEVVVNSKTFSCNTLSCAFKTLASFSKNHKLTSARIENGNNVIFQI